MTLWPLADVALMITGCIHCSVPVDELMAPTYAPIESASPASLPRGRLGIEAGPDPAEG